MMTQTDQAITLPDEDRDEMTPQPTHDIQDMMQRVGQASALMKALAHEGRLMILCHLSSGEKTVGELESLLEQRQAAVSQQLARLRTEGLVTSRRDGKARLYSVSDPRAAEVVALMYRLFCAN
jgi:ArsR family transcriptional regulator